MVCEHPKPRYSEQMESGVFVFCGAGKKCIGKEMASGAVLSQS